ncbi:MAG: metal ABC transporter substrate-binding protein [Dethiobacteria bacterium]|jgi:zinc transport system substrate-binding protein
MLRNKTLYLVIVCSLLLFFSLRGCALRESRAPVKEPAGTEVQVVTTIFPWATILQNLGGELVQVTVLLPAGASPHTYEPTVEQARAISRADLLVYTGGGLDDWIFKMAAAAEGEGTVVEVLDFLEGSLLPFNAEGAGEGTGMEGPAAERSGETHPHSSHAHSYYDPHVWTDPLLVQEKIAPALAEILAAIKPESERQFQQNLKTFQEELQVLHEDLAAAMRGFAGKRFICYHSSWNYFASRYGLGRPVHIEEFPGQEPAAKWLTELVELARELEVKVVFAEPQLSSKTAEVIAAELGGRVLILDPLGGEGLPGRDSYSGLMRYNLKVFQEGLQ